MEIENHSELPRSRWYPPPPDLPGHYGGFLPSFSRRTRATCLFTLLAILLLDTGQLDPSPSSPSSTPQLRWRPAGADRARLRSKWGATMLWLPPMLPAIGDCHANSPL